MSGIKDSERIDALRKRLYERGTPAVPHAPHTLSDTPIDVPRVWQRSADIHTATSMPPVTKVSNTPTNAPSSNAASIPVSAYVPKPLVINDAAPLSMNATSSMPTRRRKSYRLKMLAAGGVFFILALLASSAVLMFGNKGISGENITLAVTGPFTIGGGEAIPIQIGLTNDNSVSIESATLIVEYPRGTLSANEERKELFSERLALNTVASGETINVPLRAVVFGEENQEQEINVSVEYRVQGSNALFFKEADPLRYKISSSPLVITADALKKLSAGQETDITVTIKSNSPSTLQDVLVKAEYPQGFSYSSANPSPTGGQNLWLIENLEPEQSATIVIKGVAVGKETDEYAINFTVGIPNERDAQTMASVFATAQTRFELEQPFLGIEVDIAGVVNGTAVVEPNQRTSVSIEVTNTLSDTIYDIVAEVQLSGNAISDLEVGPPSGFYDSKTKKVLWDISSAPELETLAPGEKTRLTFALAPSGDVSKTPEIVVAVNIKARRVSESQVAETLTGTAKGTMKVASEPTLRSGVTYNSGTFTDSGPIPPKTEVATSYTLSWMVENGTNDISGTTVTATLPSFVTWKGETAGTGTFSYDQVKRLLSWNVGKVAGQSAVVGLFQVSILPSKSQFGTAPTLVGEQFLRADDLFTGTVVRTNSPAMTTEMSTEAGYEKGNGRVTE